MRRITVSKDSRGVGKVAVIAIVLTALVLALAASANAAEPWFREAYDIATKSPVVTKCGEPKTENKKGAEVRDIGGEAVAIFDANGDGIPDIVIVNGTSYYFVDLGKKNAEGVVSYAPEATAYPVGVTGDEKIEHVKALGLSDLLKNGKLDLYLGNSGNGTLFLKNPRDLNEADFPTNISTEHLCQDNGYRTYVNNGNGTFSYKNLGVEADGVTRTPLFADFSGDGRQDLLAFNAPYYGIWWGNSPAPSSLEPGEANGTFGKNVLPEAVVNEHGEPEPNLFEEQHGRGDVDIKGAVVRDFTGNGKPDVIASAYSDVWDSVEEVPLAPANPAGANLDLNKDGVPDGGYQGAWPHGLVALRNISTPGHIKFVNESATAFPEQGLGYGDRMDAYSTIPVELNNDGKLDLIAIGVRDFTAFNSLEFQTPIIQVFKNVSTPEHIRFENVTKESGLQFMNEPEALSMTTNGHYPVVIPEAMLGGGALEYEPNLAAGAAVDFSNDGKPDLVLVDRQFTSSNPLTGEEFYPWVFQNEGNFKFKWVHPAESGLAHTGREISYGDLGGNGREDLVTVNGSGGGQTVEDNNYVWMNEIHNENKWLEVKVRSATDALGPLGLGAKVTVYRAGTDEILGYEEMRTEYSYRSRRDAILHFGLGNVSSVDVRVEGQGLGTPVTVRDLSVDRVQTITLAPETPLLSSGATPNRTGVFSLSWAAMGSNPGFTYTLEQKNAGGGWNTVATGLSKPEYAFTGASPEGEGTWTFRVSASYEGVESEPSPASEEIKVDESAPAAPTASATRPPDYAGAGGWYKDSVGVSFAANGDPALADGSPGSGVDPASIPGPQTFDTDGPHEVCGTVADNVGNISKPGCVTVNVDATAPSIEVSCPSSVSIGAKGMFATVVASDGQSGLASPANEMVPIDTSKAGPVTVTRTAVDNVGHETSGSCSTLVGYTQVIAGNVQGKLVVKAGQAIELTDTAKVSGSVTVRPGGAIDIEGAKVSGALTAKEASVVRICAASIEGATKLTGVSSVVMGEGSETCGADSFHGSVTVKGSSAGVSIEQDAFHSSLTVSSNSGAIAVTDNTIAASLTVKGNTGTVIDRPNVVEGKSKVQ
jgi:hypothetical protein